MKREVHVVKSHEDLAQQDREYWASLSPDERVSAVEDLRLEAGRFLYEYPSRLRRVVAVTRRAQR